MLKGADSVINEESKEQSEESQENGKEVESPNIFKSIYDQVIENKSYEDSINKQAVL